MHCKCICATFKFGAVCRDGEETPKDNYFKAPRFYCVETICAPCGVVLAWTKFDKAESPTHILNWLESVYPIPKWRPDFVCIDKACAVLRTAIVNGAWETWKPTTRFIVDSYHYINHCTTDYLCRTWLWVLKKRGFFWLILWPWF